MSPAPISACVVGIEAMELVLEVGLHINGITIL